MRLRAGQDADGEAMIALITACWSEYPGCVMDLETENPHLRAPASHYARLGGTLTVAEDEQGRVVATISTVAAPNGDLELRGLYVAAPHRGSGLAQSLLRVVEKQARGRAASRLVLWSDTRFTRAHRFYERQGFVSSGPIRALHDLSNSLEYAYAKPMRPRAVERIDAASSRSAVRALAGIVRDEAFWRATAASVAADEALAFAAWYQGTLSGALVLILPQAADARHRAELEVLHVVPGVRRIGLGKALLTAAGRSAAEIGRTLLTASAGAGSPGEQFLRDAAWHEMGREVGRIPGCSRQDGRALETVIFCLGAGSVP